MSNYRHWIVLKIVDVKSGSRVEHLGWGRTVHIVSPETDGSAVRAVETEIVFNDDFIGHRFND